jgi:tetratricopeptide (TPR) repeat protein
MGIVYEAIDRWNEETIALKHVTAVPQSLLFGSPPADDKDIGLALANEFRTLTALRHPHIIRVLDFGFDANHQPYFTMELLTNARTILEAGAKLSTNEKIHLLLQMLQALAYLHHRGILHRDLKPENIVVTHEGALKLLDFGLATQRGSQNSSGTLVYMAPEILREQPATEATDLYSLGLIAYELFAGHYPFPYTSPDTYLHAALNELPPDIEAVSPKLNAVIQRLINKDPDGRYASAIETIAALTSAANLPLPQETIDIRESFLQTAPLVGREHEMVLLEDALLDAVSGKGSGWLIGGESGIGKSRLANEIRIRALIAGSIVIMGHGAQETSLSYAVWREPLRWLVMYSSAISDDDTRILKLLVPDIEEILGRTIEEPPPLKTYQYEDRLVNLILSMIQQMGAPVVLMFEDIQWMTNEELTLLARISEQITSHHCVIVCTYRQEERSDLPSVLFSMQWMPLQRFSREVIGELSQEILGHAGRDERIITFLKQHTEGNVFFIVEIIRELAERAGTLARISSVALPEYVMTGGIHTIVQRRLAEVSPLDRAHLSIAAVAGRNLDLKIIEALNPTINLELWLDRCYQQAILEFDGEGWRFAHDKIRESLLSFLSAKEIQNLHRQVAQAFEEVYGKDSPQQAQIAFHWHAAGNDEKTVVSMTLVAVEAMRVYAYKQARTALHTAIDALKRLPITPARIAQRIDLSLKLVTVSYNAATPQENLALLEDIHQLIDLQPEAQNPKRLIDIYYALGRASYYYTQPAQSLDYFRRMSIAAQNIKDPDRDAFAVTMMGRVLSQQGLFAEAISLMDASSALARLKLWTDWGINQAYLGFCRVVTGDEAGFHLIHEAVEYAKRLNHANVESVTSVFLAMAAWQMGRYVDAIYYATQTIQVSQASGDRLPLHLAFGFRAWSYSRAGDQDRAWVDFKAYTKIVEDMGGRLVYADWFAAARAELLFNTGYIGEAIQQAQLAVAMADEVGGIFGCGIAHRVWAQAISARGDIPEFLVEEHFRTSLNLLVSSAAHYEMERTRHAWDNLTAL